MQKNSLGLEEFRKKDKKAFVVLSKIFSNPDILLLLAKIFLNRKAGIDLNYNFRGEKSGETIS